MLSSKFCQLHVQPLIKLGFTPKQVASLVAALSVVANLQVEKTLQSALPKDEWKKIDHRINDLHLTGAHGAGIIADAFYHKTGYTLVQLAQTKIQEAIDILAVALKNTQDRLQNMNQIPEDKMIQVNQAVHEKNWEKLSALLLEAEN